MSLALASRASQRCMARSQRRQVTNQRFYSSENVQERQRSAHAQWYSDMLPAMVPVALLGSAVYMGLRLLQANLSHERYLDETHARVQELEREVEMLREQRKYADVVTTVDGEGNTKSRGWFW